MKSSTVTNTTITVSGGVTGTVSLSAAGTVATFTPSAALSAGTTYTVTVSTGVQDSAGNALAANYTFNFTTAVPDTTAPTVSSTTPANSATGVGTTSAISITFSEAMNPSTVTGSTITISGGATGTVTYSGTTATFTPSPALTASTSYTVTVVSGASGVKDLAGNALAADYTFSFTTAAAPDTTAPTVSSTSPSNGATSVGTSSAISITFSEAMNPSTVTSSTITISGGATGTVTYSGTTATFTPSSALTASTSYTVTVKSGALAGVKDLAGNPLATDYTLSFTTAAAPDTTAPQVTSTTPSSNATGVGTTSAISVSFTEPMAVASLTSTTFSVAPTAGGASVAGTIGYGGQTATFTPSAALASSTQYTATVTTGATDLAGNGLAATYSFNFTTGAAPDTTAPTVTAMSFANATGVALNASVGVRFSEAIDGTTVNTTTFTLTPSGGSPVAGTVSPSASGGLFDPSANLAASTVYTATVKGGASGVKDLAGNPLAADFSWTFTTGTTADSTAPTVSFTTPTSAATGVATNTSVFVQFNELVLNVDILTFALSQGGTPVAGTVTSGGASSYSFVPAAALAASTTYDVTITGGASGVTDWAGNPLAADYTFSFTTGASSDSTAPTISSATLNATAANNVGFPLRYVPIVWFSERLDPSTLGTANFTLSGPSGNVTGTVNFNTFNNAVWFIPAAPLDVNAAYTFTVGTGVSDLAGNALAAADTRSFTTIANRSYLHYMTAPASAGSVAGSLVSVDPATHATTSQNALVSVWQEDRGDLRVSYLETGTWDPTAKLLRSRSRHAVMYANAGRFYSLSAVAGGTTPTPVQMTNVTTIANGPGDNSGSASANDLCFLGNATDFANVNNSTVVYVLAGTDKTCDTADDPIYYFAYGASSATAPTQATTWNPQTIGRELSTGAAFVLGTDSSGALVKASGAGLGTITAVTGSPSGVGVANAMATLSDGRIVLQVHDTIRVYDPATNSVGATIATLSQAEWLDNTASDGTNFFFVDNPLPNNSTNVLQKISFPSAGSAGTLNSTFFTDTAGATIWNLKVTNSRIVFQGSAGIMSVAKAGGSATTLRAWGAGGCSTNCMLYLVATTPNGTVYINDRSNYTQPAAGTPDSGDGTWIALALNELGTTFGTYSSSRWMMAGKAGTQPVTSDAANFSMIGRVARTGADDQGATLWSHHANSGLLLFSLGAVPANVAYLGDTSTWRMFQSNIGSRQLVQGTYAGASSLPDVFDLDLFGPGTLTNVGGSDDDLPLPYPTEED